MRAGVHGTCAYGSTVCTCPYRTVVALVQSSLEHCKHLVQ